MKIQIVSDLHLESASQREWIKRNPLEVVGDILVLAGDIGSWKDVKELEEEEFILWATSHYKYVLMIHGNHSFYGAGDLGTIEDGFIKTKYDNLYYGFNTSVVLDGVEFILCPLWSDIDPKREIPIYVSLSDFRRIKYKGEPLTIEGYREVHRRCLKYLEEAMFLFPTEYPRVVITHHAPSLELANTMFGGDIYTSAFNSPLDSLIASSGASYWIYGHTHSNVCKEIRGVPCVCNQLGYVNHNEHRMNKYKPNFFVELNPLYESHCENV